MKLKIIAFLKCTHNKKFNIERSEGAMRLRQYTLQKLSKVN